MSPFAYSRSREWLYLYLYEGFFKRGYRVFVLRPKLCLGRNSLEALLRRVPKHSIIGDSPLRRECCFWPGTFLGRKAKEKRAGTRAKRSFGDMRSQAELGTERQGRLEQGARHSAREATVRL